MDADPYISRDIKVFGESALKIVITPQNPSRVLLMALIFKMYFSIVVAFATLPFLVGAVPASLKSSRAGHPFSIPLTKRSNHLDHRGVIGIEQMHAGLHYSTASVFPLLSL